MKFIFFFLFFFIILIPLVLAMTIPIFTKHHKATNNIINHDSVMRKFVYKIHSTKDEIINLLQIKNSNDELKCTLNLEQSTIDFAEYGSNRSYTFNIQEYNDFCILRLEQTSLIGTQSRVPYKLNPFIVSKLNAEIVPFSEYGL